MNNPPCIQTNQLPVLTDHSFSRTTWLCILSNNFFQSRLWRPRLPLPPPRFGQRWHHRTLLRLPVSNCSAVRSICTDAALPVHQWQSTHSTTWLKLRFCVKRFLSIPQDNRLHFVGLPAMRICLSTRLPMHQRMNEIYGPRHVTGSRQGCLLSFPRNTNEPTHTHARARTHAHALLNSIRRLQHAP
jgi:hypothetical protein